MLSEVVARVRTEAGVGFVVFTARALSEARGHMPHFDERAEAHGLSYARDVDDIYVSLIQKNYVPGGAFVMEAKDEGGAYVGEEAGIGRSKEVAIWLVPEAISVLRV